MLDKERGRICRKAFHYIGADGLRQAVNPEMTPGVVLDTNVVLDWFVFGEAGVAPLAAAITGGQLRWWSCRPMLDELTHVLRQGALSQRNIDSEHVLTSVNRLHASVELAAPLPSIRLRCSDPSDQMFVDLALQCGASWLFTRDRALLKLARKAAPRGLTIAPPERWPAA
jgi:uncharacterized protein